MSSTPPSGKQGSNDYGERVIETAGGDFIVTGNTQSAGISAGSADVWLVKLNSLGVEQWTKTVGGTGFDVGQDVLETSGGDFIVVGDAASYDAGATAEHIIIKFNSSGVEQWTKYWGGSGTDRAQAVIEVSDGYVVTGEGNTSGGGSNDLTLTKFNTSGQLVWARTVGGASNDQGLDMLESNDGGFAVIGYAASYPGGTNVDDQFFAKFNSDGNINDCADCRVYYVAESTATVTETDRTATTDNATDPAWSMTDRTSSTTLTDFTSTLANDFVCGEGLTYMKLTNHGSATEFNDGIATDDGGYVGAGSTTGGGAGGTDATIVKYDSTGQVVWYYLAGGTSNDVFYSVAQTNDGGYLAAGSTASFGVGGAADGYLVKLSSNGALEWSRTAGGTSGDYFYDAIQTSDGGFLAVGYTNGLGAGGTSDAYIVKYNSSATYDWSRMLGGSTDEAFYSVTETYDGGFVVAGGGNLGAGGTDGYLAKYTSGGTLEWLKTAGGTSNDYFFSATQTYDGGYIAAGSTSSYVPVGSEEAYVVKFNSSGGIEWSRTLDYAISDSLSFRDVIQAADGGYLAAASMSDGTSFIDGGLFLKLDASGNSSWFNSFSTGDLDGSALYSAVQAKDGGFVAFGEASGDEKWLVKTDSSGNIGSCGALCSSGGSTVSSVTSTANSPSATTSSPSPTSASQTSTRTTISSPTNTAYVANNYWMADGIIATVSTPLANLNTATTLSRADTPLRLRALLHTTTKTPSAGSKHFKLQYAVKSGTCDTSFTGESYSDVTKLSTFRSYNSRSLINGASLATSASDPTNGANQIIYQNYNGAGYFTPSSSMTRGASSLWDLGLTPYEAPDNSYCVRIVKGDGSLLDTTTYVAEVTVPIPSVQQMRHGQSFSSTNPGVKQGFYW